MHYRENCRPSSRIYQRQSRMQMTDAEFLALLFRYKKGRSNYELNRRRKHFCRKTMGLEAMLPREIPEKMNLEKSGLGLLDTSSPVSLTTRVDSSSAEVELDSDSCQIQLFLQAHALLKKGKIYQQIDGALKKSHVFRPNVNVLPQTLELQEGEERETVTSLHRDTAVGNIRFLNIFYGFSAKTFALAVNLLDRLICKVKAHPRYLSCIATSCFYIAARTQVENVFIPTPAELVKLSQCGGMASDLCRMECHILEKVEWQVEAVTPLSFLQLFNELFANSGDKRLSNPSLLTSVIAKLEVLMCQFEFSKYRAETLALSLLSCVLEDTGALHDMQHFSSLVELQCYCQISDMEFLQCRSLVIDYLQMYVSQPSRLPRLQLVWTVSRRTMNKMKPSTKVLLDLEPIWEDEDIEDDEDIGKFDSENSDSELEKKNQMQQAICRLPASVPKALSLDQSAQRKMTPSFQSEHNGPQKPFTNSFYEDDDGKVGISGGNSSENKVIPAATVANSDNNNNMCIKMKKIENDAEAYEEEEEEEAARNDNSNM